MMFPRGLQNLGQKWQNFGIVPAPVVFVQLCRFGAVEKNSSAVQAKWHGQLLERAQHGGIDRLRDGIDGEHAQGSAVQQRLRPSVQVDAAEEKVQVDGGIGLQEWPVLPGDAELDVAQERIEVAFGLQDLHLEKAGAKGIKVGDPGAKVVEGLIGEPLGHGRFVEPSFCLLACVGRRKVGEGDVVLGFEVAAGHGVVADSLGFDEARHRVGKLTPGRINRRGQADGVGLQNPALAVIENCGEAIADNGSGLHIARSGVSPAGEKAAVLQSNNSVVYQGGGLDEVTDAVFVLVCFGHVRFKTFMRPRVFRIFPWAGSHAGQRMCRK